MKKPTFFDLKDGFKNLKTARIDSASFVVVLFFEHKNTVH